VSLSFDTDERVIDVPPLASPSPSWLASIHLRAAAWSRSPSTARLPWEGTTQIMARRQPRWKCLRGAGCRKHSPT